MTRDSIASVYQRIAGHIRKTPVIDTRSSDFGLDGAAFPISLKLECLQYSGSFKARGAFATLLSDAVPAAGVAAASGGNHGAAVAFAAQQLGVPAHIFVPEISSPAKIARIHEYGAILDVNGANYSAALERCTQFISRSGALGIHAYDAPSTLTGQGTLGLELEAQAPGLQTLLVAVGGGGLIGGLAAWYEGRIRIIAVEPRTSCALHGAFAAGHPVDVEVSGLAADSLGARRVGDLMWPLAETYVEDVVLVDDDAISQAQRRLWRELRIVAEPGGATAMAALLSGAYRPAEGERVGVLVCGANTDVVAFPD